MKTKTVLLLFNYMRNMIIKSLQYHFTEIDMKLVNKNYDHFLGGKKILNWKNFQDDFATGHGFSREIPKNKPGEAPKRKQSNQRPFEHLVKTRGTWICYLDREAQLDVDPLELLLLLV